LVLHTSIYIFAPNPKEYNFLTYGLRKRIEKRELGREKKEPSFSFLKSAFSRHGSIKADSAHLTYKNIFMSFVGICRMHAQYPLGEK